jgi:predicted PurR-regulated permease PerM
MTLNPMVILISLILWGWICGFPGVLLAVPILAAFKIFCDHVEPLGAIGEFLSD